MNYWKEGLFAQRSSWLSLSKYAGLFKINWAKAIFSTEPASWIKEAPVVHLWKERHIPPRVLRRADSVSNYAINTMAGLLSEIVRYNCIQPFISEAKQLILCVQVWGGPKATPRFSKCNRRVNDLIGFRLISLTGQVFAIYQ